MVALIGQLGAPGQRSFVMPSPPPADDITATRLQAEIRTLVPTVIRAAEAADRTPSITDTRQELAGLCAEQEKALRRLGDMQQRLRELTNEEDNSQ